MGSRQASNLPSTSDPGLKSRLTGDPQQTWAYHAEVSARVTGPRAGALGRGFGKHLVPFVANENNAQPGSRRYSLLAKTVPSSISPPLSPLAGQSSGAPQAAVASERINECTMCASPLQLQTVQMCLLYASKPPLEEWSRDFLRYVKTHGISAGNF